MTTLVHVYQAFSLVRTSEPVWYFLFLNDNYQLLCYPNFLNLTFESSRKPIFYIGKNMGTTVENRYLAGSRFRPHWLKCPPNQI